MRRSAMVSVGLALVASVAPVTARADVLTPVVVGDVVIEGGTHVVDFPIVVGPGSSLTFRNATVYLNWEPPVCTHGTAGYCQPNIMVNGGTLRVENSRLSSQGWDIEEPDSGFSIHGVAATFDFRGSTFDHFHGIGDQVPGITASTVVGNAFRWAISALTFTRGAEVNIKDNSFEDIMYAVAVRDSSGAIRGNRFNRIQRLFATNPFGRAIDIQSTVVGDKAFVTLPIVEDNLVENGVQGILSLNGFGNIVRNNVVRNNAVGAIVGLTVGEGMVHHDASVWTGNLLEDNGVALSVYASGTFVTDAIENRLLPFHGNSLVGTRCTDVLANPTGAQVVLTVDVNDNWWGAPSPPADRGPSCPALDGDRIILDRWLTSAP